VVFSFADYGGLRFEPYGVQISKNRKYNIAAEKVDVFCIAKWSAVPTSQPLSVRSVASKAGQHPIPATKKDSIVDTISAKEFCFLALKPLISMAFRVFFLL